jgi:hypothetical protein
MITVNGDFTTEHFGEHQFTVIASDHGTPPLETATKLIVRIDGSFYTQTQTTTPSASSSSDYEIEETGEESSAGPLLFSRATLPPHYTAGKYKMFAEKLNLHTFRCVIGPTSRFGITRNSIWIRGKHPGQFNSTNNSNSINDNKRK